MLEIERLSASYGRLRVLFDVDLTVGNNEIVCVLGANGAGKSTLLKAISRLVPACTGSIRYRGVELLRQSYEAVVRHGVVHVPEGRQIFSSMSVKDNLELGAFLYGRDRKKVARQLGFVFELFPRLAERKSQLAGTLSGGEQQMLAIGRGLMSVSNVLMLDEPSLGLAPLITEQIFGILRGLPEQGISLLLVEQNARAALAIAHRGYLLENGRVAEAGLATDLARKGRVREIYIGR